MGRQYQRVDGNGFCKLSWGNLELENTEHYFFRYPKYVNERVKLFHETRDFHPLNINLILFGDANISLESNTTIFKSVQNYIKNTRRFSDS